MTADTVARKIDLALRVPRPSTSQHLSALQACIVWFSVWTQIGILAVTGPTASICLCLIPGVLGLDPDWANIAYLAAAGNLLLTAYVGFDIHWGTYAPFFRRETHGKARWADLDDLRERGFVRSAADVEKGSPRAAAMLGLGHFARKRFKPFWEFALPLNEVAAGFVIFGPPGSGKTASFFLSVARQWADLGAAVVLDLKGQMHAYSAAYYLRADTIDFINPAATSRLPIVDWCLGDPERADEVASLVVGHDPDVKSFGNEEFFALASVNLLKCLLLHVAAKHPGSSLGDVSDLLNAGLTADKDGNPVIAAILVESEAVGPTQIGAFLAADPRTRGNIAVSLDTILKQFTLPAARAVFAGGGPNPVYDLASLRKPGHACYVSVSESDMARYNAMLRLVFGFMAAALRRDAVETVECHTLFLLDEAGNFKIHGLAKDINVGRERKICYGLGFQNKPQLDKLYTRDGAATVLNSLGTYIFLPGCKLETADLLVKLAGRTTVLQRITTDAKDDRHDSHRESEVATDLVSAEEIRRMLPYREAVAVVKDCPVIRFEFPENQIIVDPERMKLRYFTPAGESEVSSS